MAGFDPSQPRDSDGKWTKDGSGAGRSAREAAGLKTDAEKFIEELDKYPYEVGGVFTPDGELMFTQTQKDPRRVEFNPGQTAKMRGNTMIHNHPEHDLTFSISDISMMISAKLEKSIVVTDRYIYTFTMKENENFGFPQMSAVLVNVLSRWTYELDTINSMANLDYKSIRKNDFWSEVAAWVQKNGVDWTYERKPR